MNDATNVRQGKRSTRTAQAATQSARAHAMSSDPGSAATVSGDESAAISPDNRKEMIAIAAYYRALRRDFCGGSCDQDWFEAEAEIDRAQKDRQDS